jgi:uncharacterized membrane protein
MSAPVEVLMAVFPDRPRAEVTVDSLKQMAKRGDIEILDAALVEKDVSGKVHIDEVKELTSRKGATRGAAIGGALGLIFPPTVLASAALGAAAGGLIGKLRDTGIKTADLKQAGAELQPGQAGVIAIVEATWAERLVQTIQGQQKLERLVLQADEAAFLVADPETGDAAGVAWATTDTRTAGQPEGASPAPGSESSMPPAEDTGTSTTQTGAPNS